MSAEFFVLGQFDQKTKNGTNPTLNTKSKQLTKSLTLTGHTYDKKSTLLPDICSVVGYLIVKWQLKMSDKGSFIKNISICT